MLLKDGADDVAQLKRTHDKSLVIFGSSILVQSLLRRKLVDEFVLQIHPVVIGRGRRLFVDVPLTDFTLLDCVTSPSGVIVATYQLT